MTRLEVIAMTDVQALEACRAAYEALQAQRHVVALQGDIRPPQDAEYLLSESRTAAERTLDAARQAYRASVPVAMAALDGLEGRVYDVLWRYYVLGCTTRVIADQRGESHRTITKAKARGLQILAARGRRQT